MVPLFSPLSELYPELLSFPRQTSGGPSEGRSGGGGSGITLTLRQPCRGVLGDGARTRGSPGLSAAASGVFPARCQPAHRARLCGRAVQPSPAALPRPRPDGRALAPQLWVLWAGRAPGAGQPSAVRVERARQEGVDCSRCLLPLPRPLPGRTATAPPRRSRDLAPRI